MRRKSFTGFNSGSGTAPVDLVFGGKLHEFKCEILLISLLVPFWNEARNGNEVGLFHVEQFPF